MSVLLHECNEHEEDLKNPRFHVEYRRSCIAQVFAAYSFLDSRQGVLEVLTLDANGIGARVSESEAEHSLVRVLDQLWEDRPVHSCLCCARQFILAPLLVFAERCCLLVQCDNGLTQHAGINACLDHRQDTGAAAIAESSAQPKYCN